jgi:hypothetical protein
MPLLLEVRMASVRQHYTAEERERVLADVVKFGVVGAAKRHGIPDSCCGEVRLGIDP